MKLALHSFALVVCIPLVALALEPTNPQGFCDRFIAEKDISLCQKRTNEEVDWYAATVCHLQKEDSAFWSCWDSIKGKSFNPQALEKCGEDKDLSDNQRQACINGADKGRKPASFIPNLPFQKLEIKRPGK